MEGHGLNVSDSERHWFVRHEHKPWCPATDGEGCECGLVVSDSAMDTDASAAFNSNGKRRRELARTKGKEKEEPETKRKRVQAKREEPLPDLPEVPLNAARGPQGSQGGVAADSGLHRGNGRSQGELQWIVDQQAELIRYFIQQQRNTTALLESVFNSSNF